MFEAVITVLVILVVAYLFVLFAIRSESRDDVRKAKNSVLRYKNATDPVDKQHLKNASRALIEAQEDLRIAWIWPIVVASEYLEDFRREREETKEATRIARLGE